MKRNKNEIIVRDERQIEEKSVMAENGHAPFSRDEQVEISETTTNQESISAPANDISVYTLSPYTTRVFSGGKSHAESHSSLSAHNATSAAATQPEQDMLFV